VSNSRRAVPLLLYFTFRVSHELVSSALAEAMNSVPFPQFQDRGSRIEDLICHFYRGKQATYIHAVQHIQHSRVGTVQQRNKRK
jgi:hypothetical protein